MKFSATRALVLGFIGLPLGFILTAFIFAVTQSAIEVSAIFPWALGVAVIAGVIGGFWRSAQE